jgi:hypothetical protein
VSNQLYSPHIVIENMIASFILFDIVIENMIASFILFDCHGKAILYDDRKKF